MQKHRRNSKDKSRATNGLTSLTADPEFKEETAMAPIPRNYSIYPSVMLADKPTEMIVLPNERAFTFPEGAKYDVTFISLCGDEKSYYAPTTHVHLSCEASEGVIRFEYTFKGEGEHLIILTGEDGLPTEFNVYSVYEDLYALTPLKGDLHSHSCRSDGKRDPAALASYYREHGYDFFALTDHNRYYHGGEIDEVYDGVDTGLTRIVGEEVHPVGSNLHVVHIGGKSSVCDLYFKDLPSYEREIEAYLDKVPEGVPEAYKNRYARAMWTTDKIHSAGGLAIYPHPFWRPGRSRVYHYCDEGAALMLKSGMFDSFELTGAMGQDGINRAVALWSDLRAEGYKINVVGSSDVHELSSPTFATSFTVCFAKSNSREDIFDAVRKGNTVAVEMTGQKGMREYRPYGSLRLVSYAQFLLKYYFEKREHICHGAGVAMKAYAMGDAPKELVELETRLISDYSLRFFGKKAPSLPDAKILDFEDRWRAVHADGPGSKGSIIFFDYESK